MHFIWDPSRIRRCCVFAARRGEWPPNIRRNCISFNIIYINVTNARQNIGLLRLPTKFPKTDMDTIENYKSNLFMELYEIFRSIRVDNESEQVIQEYYELQNGKMVMTRSGPVE